MLHLISLLLALAGPALAQDASPFDGRWVLDREASDDVQRFLEWSMRPPTGPSGGGMGGPPGGGGGMGGPPGGGGMPGGGGGMPGGGDGMPGGGGGMPGGDMGGGPASGPGGAPSGQDSTMVLIGLLAGSDRIALLVDDDLLLVSWMEGLPQPLLLGRRSWRVELPDGEHMRIRAWQEAPSEDGALVIRRKLGGVVLEEAFLPPTSAGELVVVVTATAPVLAMPLDFRRVYRRPAEEEAP